MEEFSRQEEERVLSERRKEARLKGLPMPGSPEELLSQLQNKLNENPILREFLIRIINALNEKFTLQERWYERRWVEQENIIQELISLVQEEISLTKEQRDNFNIFASKLLAQSEERLVLVRRAVATLEAELNR